MFQYSLLAVCVISLQCCSPPSLTLFPHSGGCNAPRPGTRQGHWQERTHRRADWHADPPRAQGMMITHFIIAIGASRHSLITLSIHKHWLHHVRTYTDDVFVDVQFAGLDDGLVKEADAQAHAYTSQACHVCLWGLL